MNSELIKKLAEQAKKYALDAMIKITDKEQALKVYSESYDTKFAELIVKECIKAYNDDGYQTEYEQDQKVLKHFGVEE